MVTGQGLSSQTLAQKVRLVHAGKLRLTLMSFGIIAKSAVVRLQLKVTRLKRQSGETLQRLISPQQLVHYRENWYVDALFNLRLE